MWWQGILKKPDEDAGEEPGSSEAVPITALASLGQV
jgi:hypothetical protein